MKSGLKMEQLLQRKGLIAGGMLALIVLVGAWLLGSDKHEAKLAQVLNNVKDLREVELGHRQIFSEFLGANAAPRSPDQVSPEPVPWTSTPGFEQLSWAPDNEEAVWASYSVTLEGSGFIIRANCDLDGDGEMARFQASHDQPAERISAPGIR